MMKLEVRSKNTPATASTYRHTVGARKENEMKVFEIITLILCLKC